MTKQMRFGYRNIRENLKDAESSALECFTGYGFEDGIDELRWTVGESGEGGGPAGHDGQEPTLDKAGKRVVRRTSQVGVRSEDGDAFGNLL
jgi:hypothetical protein